MINILKLGHSLGYNDIIVEIFQSCPVCPDLPTFLIFYAVRLYKKTMKQTLILWNNDFKCLQCFNHSKEIILRPWKKSKCLIR